MKRFSSVTFAKNVGKQATEGLNVSSFSAAIKRIDFRRIRRIDLKNENLWEDHRELATVVQQSFIYTLL